LNNWWSLDAAFKACSLLGGMLQRNCSMMTRWVWAWVIRSLNSRYVESRSASYLPGVGNGTRAGPGDLATIVGGEVVSSDSY
jgi:hypothetical protein